MLLLVTEVPSAGARWMVLTLMTIGTMTLSFSSFTEPIASKHY
ncbi:hypothetical protein [Streptomyces sp. NRRL S-337]|nr:hypothetical protein [Streptomyces sp. NRRL S-337]